MAEVNGAKPTHKVLVVDNEEAVVKLLALMLKKHADVSTATRGTAALKQARATKPDLILLDVMMPEMGGLEVFRELKADPETKDIPIIFLSARNDEASIARGLALGAVDYIAKPIDQTIIARIQTWLQ